MERTKAVRMLSDFINANDGRVEERGSLHDALSCLENREE